ncbi:hypothetical protein Tco_0603901 [Tanacetum coccineum]
MKAEGLLKFLREVVIFKKNRLRNRVKKVKLRDMGVVHMQQLNHNIKNKEKLKATNTGVKPMYSIAKPDGSFSINENAVRSTKDNIGINECVPYNSPLIQFSSWMGGDRDDTLSAATGVFGRC